MVLCQKEVLVSNFKALDFLSVLEGYIQDVYIFGCDSGEQKMLTLCF